MFRSLHTAATGMMAEQTHIDVIAHNMANVETTGFRRLHAEFRDLVYSELRAPGARTAQGSVVPTGVMIGSGTALASTQMSMAEGSLSPTGSPLDLAIEGSGLKHLKPGGYFVASTTSEPDIHDGVDLHQTKLTNSEWRQWIAKNRPELEWVDLGLEYYQFVRYNQERSVLTYRRKP